MIYWHIYTMLLLYMSTNVCLNVALFFGRITALIKRIHLNVTRQTCNYMS